MKTEKQKNKEPVIKKDKEEKFKEKLKEFNQNIEDLKHRYPDADFTQIEDLLSKIESTSGALTPSFSFLGFIKRIGGMFLTIVFNILVIGAVFGFFAHFINYTNPLRLMYCTLGLSFIFYFAPILISLLSFFSKSHSLDFFLTFGLILLLAFLDQSFFHICNHTLNSIVILIVVMIVLEGIKAYRILKF